jgi:integrase
MAILLYTAINGHLADLQAKGRTASTLANHRQALLHGIDTWGNIDCRDIREEHIASYFADRTWSAGTQMIYLGALRAFGAYLRRGGIWPREFDPLDGWAVKAATRVERLWLTVPQMLEMRETEPCPRNRALFALGMYTLGRAGEIVTLTVGDLDLDRGMLVYYRHKTRQWDRLPVCEELAEEMSRWLAHYADVMGGLEPHWLLVPALAPLPMTGVTGDRRLVPTGAPRRMKTGARVSKPSSLATTALHRIGFREPGNGMHVLRRSSARNLFEQLRDCGYDHALRRVGSMLGHRHTTMTEHYIGVDAERRARDEMLSGKRMFAA